MRLSESPNRSPAVARSVATQFGTPSRMRFLARHEQPHGREEQRNEQGFGQQDGGLKDQIWPKKGDDQPSGAEPLARPGSTPTTGASVCLVSTVSRRTQWRPPQPRQTRPADSRTPTTTEEMVAEFTAVVIRWTPQEERVPGRKISCHGACERTDPLPRRDASESSVQVDQGVV